MVRLTLLVIFIDRINRDDIVQPLIFIPLRFQGSGDMLYMHIPSPTLLQLIIFSNANAETAATHRTLHKLESQKTRAARRENAHSIESNSFY